MNLGRIMRQAWLGLTSRSSGAYWEQRYSSGMNSGCGSYGQLAEFKAKVLNEFVVAQSVESIVEFGCGDGNQLTLAEYPRYLGLDVSKTAIDLCSRRFATDRSKSFLWYDPQRTVNLSAFVEADLAMSLDVIYHLLEDDTYERYLRQLFDTARRFVVIYSSDTDERHPSRHVRHRPFTRDVARAFPQFELIRKIDNAHREQTFADFYFYRRHEPAATASS